VIGDSWYRTDTALVCKGRSQVDPVVGEFGARPSDIPDVIVGRPTGPGYQRYEDLYQAGDTVTQAMERCDDNVIITFPEGVFEGVDFPQVQGYASILVPKRCNGIIGSGKGTLGGSTGTIFTMTPNSSTYNAPTQGSSQPSLARVMMRIGGFRGGTFANFQVAGTEQIVAGRTHPFHGFTDYDPLGKTTIQDCLFTGWYGDNGAPPGETFGVAIHSKTGDPSWHGHRMVRMETDGRRAVGGRVFGPCGLTFQNAVGGYMVDCNLHHNKHVGFVAYQVFNLATYDSVIDQATQDMQDIVSHSVMNQERTDGITHFRLGMYRKAVDSGVHLSHSNDFATFSFDGTPRTVTNGQTTLVDPSYTPIWEGRLYIQSWDPYAIGGMEVGGDSMTSAPLVVEADGVTHIPYKWVDGDIHKLIT